MFLLMIWIFIEGIIIQSAKLIQDVDKNIEDDEKENFVHLNFLFLCTLFS